MIHARAQGIAFEHKTVALNSVGSGQVPGRIKADQVVVYKSVGAALQDLTVAALCAARAKELGLGTALPITIQPVNKGKSR